MGLLKIFGIGFLILLLIVGGVIIYFYNFHTFKTIKVCISEQAQTTTISCEDDNVCKIYFLEQANFENEYDNAPDNLKEKMDEIIDKAIFCQEVCNMKEVRGLEDIGSIESCEADEEEVVWNIKGKDGIELMKYLGNVILDVK